MRAAANRTKEARRRRLPVKGERNGCAAFCMPKPCGLITVRTTGRVSARLAKEWRRPEAVLPSRCNHTAAQRPSFCNRKARRPAWRSRNLCGGKVRLRIPRRIEPPRTPKSRHNVVLSQLHSPFCKLKLPARAALLHGRSACRVKQRLSLVKAKTFPHKRPFVSLRANGPKTAAKTSAPDGTARRLLGRLRSERPAKRQSTVFIPLAGFV